MGWEKAKSMPIFTNFVDLFSVLSYFRAKEQKFWRLRRSCSFLALINGTFERITNNAISMKTGENLFPSAEGLLSVPFSSTKFSSAIKLIKCGKVQSLDNISPHIF